MSGKFITRYREDLKLFRTTPSRVIAVLITALALLAPFALSSSWDPPLEFPWRATFSAVNLALAWAIGAAAFNLLLGYTGQISIAHAAFLILAALVGAIFGQASAGLGWTFWIILPMCAAAGAIVGMGVGLPALRIRGLYLFMATLSVHFFAIFIWRQYQVRAVGFTGVRYFPPEVPSWLFWLPFIDPDENGEFLIRGNFRWYWVMLGVATFCILFMVNVLRTREGRAFIAVRDNDVAASLYGINVARTKLRSFAVSSAMVAVSGCLLAYFLTARSDESWSIEIILDVAIMTVVGGFSTIVGGVLGAFFFFLAPIIFEWLRAAPALDNIGFINTYAAQLDLAIFGFLVIIVLVFKPAGLAGIWADIKRYFRQWPYRY